MKQSHEMTLLSILQADQNENGRQVVTELSFQSCSFFTDKATDNKQNRKKDRSDDDDSSDGEAENSNDENDGDSDQESVSSESEDADVDVSQSDVTLMTAFGGKHKEVSDDEDALLRNRDEERQQTLKSLRKHHR